MHPTNKALYIHHTCQLPHYSMYTAKDSYSHVFTSCFKFVSGPIIINKLARLVLC